MEIVEELDLLHPLKIHFQQIIVSGRVFGCPIPNVHKHCANRHRYGKQHERHLVRLHGEDERSGVVCNLWICPPSS